jgi:hypothetical protein
MRIAARPRRAASRSAERYATTARGPCSRLMACSSPSTSAAAALGDLLPSAGCGRPHQSAAAAGSAKRARRRSERANAVLPRLDQRVAPGGARGGGNVPGQHGPDGGVDHGGEDDRRRRSCGRGVGARPPTPVRPSSWPRASCAQRLPRVERPIYAGRIDHQREDLLARPDIQRPDRSRAAGNRDVTAAPLHIHCFINGR